MEFTELLDFLQVVWQESAIKWILLTVLVNSLTAVAAAVHTGNFSFHRLGEFLYRKILPYGGLYCGYWVIGQAIDLSALTTIAFAAVEVALAADLIESLGELGLKIPARLQGAVSKE